MNNQKTTKCPRCEEGRICAWQELNDDQREVVRRLPGAAAFTAAEREALHRWCTRCWYETKSESVDA